MDAATQQIATRPGAPAAETAKAQVCTLVIFDASGDLTKRLLMPVLYNLAGNGLLSNNFKVIEPTVAMPATTTGRSL